MIVCAKNFSREPRSQFSKGPKLNKWSPFIGHIKKEKENSNKNKFMKIMTGKISQKDFFFLVSI